MNHRQRLILIVCAVLIAAMLLYPPFQFMGRGKGYSWIFSPSDSEATINAGQLLVQWAAVALIGGISFLLSKEGSLSSHSVDTKNMSVVLIPAGTLTTIFVVLRTIRALAGLIGGWQIVGLLTTCGWLATNNAANGTDMGKIGAAVLVKLLTASICYGVFTGLRAAVNKLHFNRYGVQHPILVNKWRL